MHQHKQEQMHQTIGADAPNGLSSFSRVDFLQESAFLEEILLSSPDLEFSEFSDFPVSLPDLEFSVCTENPLHSPDLELSELQPHWSVSELFQNSPRTVPELSQNCPWTVSELFQNCSRNSTLICRCRNSRSLSSYMFQELSTLFSRSHRLLRVSTLFVCPELALPDCKIQFPCSCLSTASSFRPQSSCTS